MKFADGTTTQEEEETIRIEEELHDMLLEDFETMVKMGETEESADAYMNRVLTLRDDEIADRVETFDDGMSGVSSEGD